MHKYIEKGFLILRCYYLVGSDLKHVFKSNAAEYRYKLYFIQIEYFEEK